MIGKNKRRLRVYLEELLGAGRTAFSRTEAEQALGLGRSHFLQSARRLEKQGKLYSPRSGYYVIVPPQFLSWGAPPPSWFIDGLMRHEKRPYYIALLKAAELHGAAHQAVMEFQVITNARLPKLHAGRSLIVFYYRRNFTEIVSAIQEHKTDTGIMRISSPELTALDLLRYPHAAGGIDNILTVLRELGSKLDGAKLAILCPHFERTVRQRLGYLLSQAGHLQVAEVLRASLLNDRLFRWVELDPVLGSSDPDLVPVTTQRDSRWRLIVRRQPEADQE
jgi:predicted transcriptional regulator of viral defense system